MFLLDSRDEPTKVTDTDNSSHDEICPENDQGGAKE